MSETLMRRLPGSPEDQKATEADAFRTLHKTVREHERALELVDEALTVARRSHERVKATIETLEDTIRTTR